MSALRRFPKFHQMYWYEYYFFSGEPDKLLSFPNAGHYLSRTNLAGSMSLSGKITE